jgi:protein TonB
MFDHYLEYQKPDSKRARLLRRALVVSTTGTSLVLAWLWVQGKLAIVQVDPPAIAFIMVQMTQDEPPPPPPPPPPPAAEQEQEEEVVEEDEPIEEITQPDEVKDKIPEVKKVPFKSGLVGGVPGGVPGGVLGGSFGNQVKQANTNETVKSKLEAVMGRIVYQPEVSQQALLQTPTGKFAKKPGSTTVGFCIEPTGKISEVRTVRGFPGDPAIDAIFRDLVKKWRGKPLVVGGKSRRECSEKTFNIKWK